MSDELISAQGHSHAARSNGASRQGDIPFALKLTVTFMAIDIVRRLAALFTLFLVGNEHGAQLVLFHLLWIITDCLLVTLINLRANAARYWLMLVVAVHGLYLVSHVAIREPLIWISATNFGRVQVLTSLLINALLIHLMLREDVVDYLDE